MADTPSTCRRRFRDTDLDQLPVSARDRRPNGVPSPRKITSWIVRPRETLTESQEERLLEVRLACPDIPHACDLARTFADLVRHQLGRLLLEWIRQAEH
ncbi:hypothetical protein [Streptomyces lydicus]|uniref:hypothetical protein n=1 Tax=Streptomyces lydicus TaxID=47763 RepID=UPI0013DE5052|nr:hypothetical protein [Streptomyces lydicus]